MESQAEPALLDLGRGGGNKALAWYDRGSIFCKFRRIRAWGGLMVGHLSRHELQLLLVASQLQAILKQY